MRLFTNTETDESIENTPVSSNEEDTNNSNVQSFVPGPRLVEEDSLLIQIDEFRKKAEALQSLINDRQGKVFDLEETVKEKEEQNQKLQEALNKKQEALSGVLDDMKSQFDILANRVDTSVNNAVNDANEPVLDKIHTENVRLYRNLYDFIKEDYDTEEMETILTKSSNQGKGLVKFGLFLTVVNTALLVVLLLLQYGII